MFVYELDSLINPKYIINFPTKRHWRGASRIEDIESGLTDLISVINERHITSIALPPLGAGLGGLDWNIVKAAIEKAFMQIQDVEVIVFEPSESAQTEKSVKSITAPDMTPGRAALVGLAHHYLGGLLDPFITLLELHKLMYLLQESGEPLKLRYVKAPHGPYAKNLSHVLNAVEGHLLSGYYDGGDKPDKQIKIVPGAEQDAQAFLAQNTDTADRIKRVCKAVEGFETPFGLELLTTVHWVATREAKTMSGIIDSVYAWGVHKQQFSPRQINVAAERLAGQGWISIS
jgi:O-acetyl-ADP-ribose deacetylase (regulator of RNase III)